MHVLMLPSYPQALTLPTPPTCLPAHAGSVICACPLACTPSSHVPISLHHRPTWHMRMPMHLHAPAHSCAHTFPPMCTHMGAVSFLFFLSYLLYSALLIKQSFYVIQFAVEKLTQKISYLFFEDSHCPH